MRTSQILPCPHCATERRCSKRVPPRHVHAILSLCTLGLWLPVWLRATLRTRARPWRCRTCGSAVYPTGRPRTPLAPALAVAEPPR